MSGACHRTPTLRELRAAENRLANIYRAFRSDLSLVERTRIADEYERAALEDEQLGYVEQPAINRLVAAALREGR